MEEVSGRDLGWFYSQWLERHGTPRLEGTWRYDVAKKAVGVTLTQTQPGNPFQITVEVGLNGGGSDARQVERISFGTSRHTTWLPASQPPTAVVLDPNTWLLADLGAVDRVK
jgi:aminopeptidase N